MPEHASIGVLGLPVSVVSMADAVAWIVAATRARRTGRADGAAMRTAQVVTLNPEIVMAARQDASLRDAILRADLVVPDGIGVVLAARFAGGRVRERVTGVDLLEQVASVAPSKGLRLFLLGGGPGTAETAAARLMGRYPDLKIAGTSAGSPGTEDERDILTTIRCADPDIVFVAFGSPAQERWIAGVRDRLHAAVAIGVGGALDFVSGHVPRAPEWMRRAGMEWAYRLARQPWRWRRMLALPRFAGMVLVDVWQQRRRRVRGGYSKRFDAET